MDGLDRHIKDQTDISKFFEKIKALSDKYGVKFVFSMSGDISGTPDYVIKEYTC